MRERPTNGLGMGLDIARMLATVYRAALFSLGLGPQVDFLLPEKYDSLRQYYGPTILDFGAGTCLYARLLADKGHQVTALDVVNKSREPAVNLLVYDGLPLDFPDSTFDTTLCFFVLHHLDEQEPTLRELARITRDYLIIGEDLEESWIDRILTGTHRLTSGWGKPKDAFRSQADWQRLFGELRLEIVGRVRIPRHYIPYYPIRRMLFVLRPR